MPETTQKLRPMQHWFPGKMAYASTKGHNPGVRVTSVKPDPDIIEDFSHPSDRLAEAINRWAEDNFGMLVVDIHFTDHDTAFIFYTKALSDEEMELFQEDGEIFEKYKTEYKRKRDEALVKQEEKFQEAKNKAEIERVKAAQELARLADLGAIHERNCKKKAGK